MYSLSASFLRPVQMKEKETEEEDKEENGGGGDREEDKKEVEIGSIAVEEKE